MTGEQSQSINELFDTPDTVEPDEVDDLNKAYARCFSTPSGRKVLAHLVSMRNAATWNATLGLLNGVAYGFAREGQNTLINEIEMRVENGKRRD